MLIGDISRFGAKRFGAKTAIIHEDRRLTYRELNCAVNRLANSLSEHVVAGDTVAMLSANCIEYVVLLFAAAKCGLVLQSVNHAYCADEFVHVMNDARPKILFVDQSKCELVEETLPRCKSTPLLVGLFKMARPGWQRYDQLLASGSDQEPQITIDPDVAFSLLYTSGTTGAAKGVLLSQRGLMNTFRSLIIEGDIKNHDVGMVNLPLSHAAGMFAVTVPLLMRGASVLLMSGSFDPEKILTMVARYRISMVMWVPTMLAMLVNFAAAASYDVSSLKKLYYGSSPINPLVYQRARAIFSADFYQYYGQTESGIVAVLGPEDHENMGSCTGREMFDCEIRIIDSHGGDVPVGAVGEVITTSESVMFGYLNNEQKTEKTLRNGWVYTEDLARAEANGYFTIVGRIKDMIISGGKNIYAREVEEVIGRHPAVQEVAVFGIPDDIYGESVCAAIVLGQGFSLNRDEIIQFCSHSLSGYKKPRSIIFKDELPKNSTGKITKDVLRRPYWKNSTQSLQVGSNE
ncbi:MAG: AMP-binding protein, partial [Alphaproteobacteria bacterium]|nr:AMP-binding protein [Alphaproteobacteria bacterium]